jgi:predicted acetyltransferase
METPEQISDWQVRPATPSDRNLLRALLDDYLHELSAFGPVDAAYPYFDSYFQEPDRFAYLVEILIGDWAVPAGFALVNRHSPSGLPIDHAMAEFSILPAFRRTGLGRHVVQRIFARHPGQWELSVAGGNAAAWSFWCGMVGASPGFAILERDDARSLRFQIAASLSGSDPCRILQARG